MPTTRSRFSSSRLSRRRRQVLIRQALLYGGALFLLIAISIGVTYIPNIQIGTVSVTGISTISEEEVTTFLKEQLQGKYWHLFPKSNALLYPRSNMEASVLEAFPRLASAQIELQNFQGIQVNVTERHPAALWCGIQNTSGAPCYFTDQNGFLYSNAPEFQGGAFLRIFGSLMLEQSGIIGSQILQPEEFKQALAFILSLEDLSIRPRTLEITPEGDYILYLPQNTKILLSRDQNLSLVRDNIESLLTSPEFKGVPLEKFLYIDLRFGNKVYVKEK